MRVLADRSARTMFLSSVVAVAATLGFTAPTALAAAAGSAKPLARDGSLSLKQASDLISANKLVEAQAVIEKLMSSDAVSAGDKNAASALAQVVKQRMSEANPLELSLQKAAFALSGDDLRGAERQASSIINNAGASADLKAKAGEIVSKVTARRGDVAAEAPMLLTKAQADFDAGRFAEAKASVDTLNKWGVAMSDADQARVDALQLKIVEMSKIDGGSITGGGHSSGGASMPATTGGGVVLVKDEMGAVPAANRVDAAAPALPGKAPEPFFPYEGKASEPVASQPEVAQSVPMTNIEPAAVVSAAPVEQPAAQPAPSGDNLMLLALKAEAQRALFAADQSFDGGRFNEALRQYEGVLAAQRQYLTSDEIARAERRIAECRVRLQSPTGGTLEDSVMKNYSLVREKAQAEFDNALSEAEKALAAGDANKARNLASGGQLSVDRARTYFSQSEYDAMTTRVNDLRRTIDKRATEIDTASRAKAEADAKAAAESTQKNLRAEKDRRVAEGIDRIRALQREQKYDEALEVTNQVLFMDPTNPSGLLLKDIISDVLAFRRSARQDVDMRNKLREFRMDNRGALAPSTNIVDYPTDWPRLTMLRTGAGGYYETPANRAAMASLEGRKIPVQFRNIPVRDALAYVGKTVGVDIDPDWRSLETIGVSPESLITIDFQKDAPAKQVLEKIISRISKDRFQKADYAIKDGIIEVGSADSIKQQTVVEHYPITDLLAVAPDYADVPETDLAKIMAGTRNGKVDAGRDPFMAKAESNNKSGGDRQSRVRSLVQMIQQNIDAESWRDNGGDVGTVMELNGVLVITATPRNHREITGLLSRLREIRQTQISVEARFLLVNQNFFEQISFDLDIYLNANSNQVTEARAFDPTIRPSDFFAFPGSQFQRRTLDGAQYGASADNGAPTQIPFTRGGGGAGAGAGNGQPQTLVQPTSLPANWSPIGFGGNSAGLTRTLTPSSNEFVSNLLGAAPALGIAGQYLDDIQVDFLIKATQADSRTITLNAPRLTFTNGQIANVVVGSQRAYISDLEVVSGDGAIGFNPTPATLSDGVSLLIEGVTSADRRYVTLNVEAGVSTVQSLANFPVTATAGQRVVSSDQAGGATSVSSNVQLPLISLSRVNTTVTVPDQGTMMLGGQRLTSELEIETGVPVLSKIPIINRFFTNRVEAKQDSTLLILLKPTVIVQSEQEDRFFPGLNDALRGN